MPAGSCWLQPVALGCSGLCRRLESGYTWVYWRFRQIQGSGSWALLRNVNQHFLEAVDQRVQVYSSISMESEGFACQLCCSWAFFLMASVQSCCHPQGNMSSAFLLQNWCCPVLKLTSFFFKQSACCLLCSSGPTQHSGISSLQRESGRCLQP